MLKKIKPTLAGTVSKLKKDSKMFSYKRIKKKYSMFRPQIRSRHPTHKILRTALPALAQRSVIRLGSTTELADTVSKGGNRIEINTVEAIKNSASKFRMKKCFQTADIKTAKWAKGETGVTLVGDHLETGNGDLKFPLVAKLNFGSRGQGMHLIETQADWNRVYNVIRGRISEYLFEEYHDYSREYRLHVNPSGCFYTCRKLLKDGEKDRWYRNDSNCNWVRVENPKFNMPKNWNAVVAECVKAMKAVGLDFGKIQVPKQN